MSKSFSEGYLKHPGFGNTKLGLGSTPNQEILDPFTKNTHLNEYRGDLGHCVKSIEEANIARCFLISGLDYIYEPKAFPLNVTMGADLFRTKRTTYTPDFFIPNTGDYIEVKGTWTPESIGTKALMKILMFIEQYPDKKLVLIQSYDYRKNFSGLDLKVKEEILIPEMKKVFAVPIKEHPDLFWWESGNKKGGYNVHTCPTFFGEESEIDDGKRYLHIMWWKTPNIISRLLSEIKKYEKQLEEAEFDCDKFEEECKPYVGKNKWEFQSFLSSVGSITHNIRDARSYLSLMYSVVNDFEEDPYTDLSEFEEFGELFEVKFGDIKMGMEEIENEYKGCK